MINNDRIVPVERIDLLSLYATMLTIAGMSFNVLNADTVDGQFTVSEAGSYIANQPVKSANFTAESGTLYFVADYDFEGIKVNGADAMMSEGSEEVNPNAKTLFKASLNSGIVTIFNLMNGSSGADDLDPSDSPTVV